ncbi:MAG TPA: hypothetical protein VGF56_08500 [Rhizomicrobium sp.]|jgi:hypothetical protein
MRRVLGVLSLIAFATGASGASWTTLNDPDGTFTVNMPSTPKVSHDSITNTDNTPVDMLEYTVDRGDNAMIVIVSDLTRYPNADASKVIDGAVGGASKSGTKTVDRIVILDGQSGRDITIVDKSGNHINDRIFFVGGKLYQVMYVVPEKPTADVNSDVRRYSQSFHFTHY